MSKARSYALNHQLRRLLDESGLTGEALASEINAAGARRGLALRYSRSSVAHWLAGVRPRKPVPALVAEVFTDRLGRPVPVAQTGLVVEAAASDAAHVDDIPAQLAELAELATLMQDAAALDSAVGRNVAGRSPPEWSAVSTPVQRTRRSDPDKLRIGRSEVAAACLMRDLFAAADAERGGGHTMLALGLYLGTTLATWLRADASPAVRRELLAAAAQLCYLFGFISFDEMLTGLARRHYLISAQLAREAGDPGGYAIALRGLSVQAHHHGDRNESRDLAERALRAVTGQAVHPLTMASVHGQLAVAAATAGEHSRAMDGLRAAEHYLDRNDGPAPAIGAFNAASLAYQQAEVAVASGAPTEAIRLLRTSTARRPPKERRSHAVVLARLAELQIGEGQLDAALESWRQLLVVRSTVRSARVDAAVAAMRGLVEPHRDNPSVQALLERADAHP
ncbi:hypothetical protein WEH80_40585 [Actinomycetes bacterium KLBMP 9759]